jgi:hypothetical protein
VEVAGQIREALGSGDLHRAQQPDHSARPDFPSGPTQHTDPPRTTFSGPLESGASAEPSKTLSWAQWRRARDGATGADQVVSPGHP